MTNQPVLLLDGLEVPKEFPPENTSVHTISPIPETKPHPHTRDYISSERKRAEANASNPSQVSEKHTRGTARTKTSILKESMAPDLARALRGLANDPIVRDIVHRGGAPAHVILPLELEERVPTPRSVREWRLTQNPSSTGRTSVDDLQAFLASIPPEGLQIESGTPAFEINPTDKPQDILERIRPHREVSTRRRSASRSPSRAPGSDEQLVRLLALKPKRSLRLPHPSARGGVLTGAAEDPTSRRGHHRSPSIASVISEGTCDDRASVGTDDRTSMGSTCRSVLSVRASSKNGTEEEFLMKQIERKNAEIQLLEQRIYMRRHSLDIMQLTPEHRRVLHLEAEIEKRESEINAQQAQLKEQMICELMRDTEQIQEIARENTAVVQVLSNEYDRALRNEVQGAKTALSRSSEVVLHEEFDRIRRRRVVQAELFERSLDDERVLFQNEAQRFLKAEGEKVIRERTRCTQMDDIRASALRDLRASLREELYPAVKAELLHHFAAEKTNRIRSVEKKMQESLSEKVAALRQAHQQRWDQLQEKIQQLEDKHRDDETMRHLSTELQEMRAVCEEEHAQCQSATSLRARLARENEIEEDQLRRQLRFERKVVLHLARQVGEQQRERKRGNAPPPP